MEQGSISIVDNKVVITSANGTVWLTQHQIADLFECFVAKVSSNIRAILKADILDERKVCRLHRYDNNNSVELYNLEMITALAFRIRTHNARVFREWLMKKAISQTLQRQIIVIENRDKLYLN